MLLINIRQHRQFSSSIQNDIQISLEVLFRLIHNTKSSLSTAAMALHNLSYILTEENKEEYKDASSDEFIHAAQLAIDETNTRLVEAVSFARNSIDNFEPIDLKATAERAIGKMNTSATIMADLPDHLPILKADSAALSMVFQKLILLSMDDNSGKQIIHFHMKMNLVDENIIICNVFNHKYLGKATQNQKPEILDISKMNDEKKLQFEIVKIIISRHGSKIEGIYSKDAGGTWKFILQGIKE